MISITDKAPFFTRRHRLVCWTQQALLASGAFAILYVGFTLLGAKIYQERAGLTLDMQIHAQERLDTGLLKLTVKEGDVLGRMEIPRIRVSVVVLQGTSSQTLRNGVGHIEGTALPGEPGNVGIAGHRDTYFRALKDIRANDEIQIQTAAGITQYKVDWIQITVPGDVAIVSTATESALTLVTCYPFHFIGAAPERFVVHAHKL
jgi:sortase A